MHVFTMGSEAGYYRMVISAIFIGVCHVFIGATVMTILIYCMDTNFADVHVALCSFGFHFFSAEAILFLNYANGLATPMRIKHRRCAHSFLQVCAMILVFTGTIMIMRKLGETKHAHGLSGIIAFIFAICSLVSAPFAVFSKGRLKLVHTVMGMPTFAVSSICFCLGFFTTEFKTWAGDTLVYILIGFVAFYTSVIILRAFFNCLSRL